MDVFDIRIEKLIGLCTEIIQESTILEGLGTFRENEGKLENQNNDRKRQYAFMMAYLGDKIVNDFYSGLGWLFDPSTEIKDKKTMSFYQFIWEYKNDNITICNDITNVLNTHEDTIKKIIKKRNKLIAHYDLKLMKNNNEDEFIKKNKTNYIEIIALVIDLWTVLKNYKKENTKLEVMSSECSYNLLIESYNNLK